MDFKKIFRNDKAVSPVIGVVLMVAITVILAAAIGSSVFGQGTAKSAPQANIDIKAVNVTGDGYIKFEHLGGDPIHFESNSTTKVMASVNGGNSVDIYVTELDVFDVGDVQVLELNGTSVSVGQQSQRQDHRCTDQTAYLRQNYKVLNANGKHLFQVLSFSFSFVTFSELSFFVPHQTFEILSSILLAVPYCFLLT